VTNGEKALAEWIAAETAGTESVLDVGTGPGKFLRHARSPLRIGLDAQAPGFGQIRLQGDAMAVLPLLGTDSVDVVMSTDFLEHLERPDSELALWHMLRIARRKVLVFTPDGFAPQHDGLPNAKRFTPEEWKWQTHRCGWTRAELEECGFRVEHWPWGWESHPAGGIMATRVLS
jgi:SAM-dependent methyltransferase